MKKILFLLLCTVSMYGQVSTGQEQEFDYGIKNNSTQTVTTPTYLGTVGADGTYGKILLSDLQGKKAFLSTGLIKNGLISANGDPTKFNITAGIGIISNFDDPENPTSTIVNFPAFTGITPTYLLTGTITYVAINDVATVVMQATPFTPEQRRSFIVLGAVVHSNLTTINVINNISAPTNASTNQLHDFIEAVGALNLTGNKYTANGANLQLDKSAGLIFKLGSNFANDWKNPHELAQTAGTSLTFRYRTQNGTEGSDRINLDPALYDLSNVLTAVPNNKFTIQTVVMFQSGVTRIQYGQNVYDDLATAKSAVFTRNFILEPNSKENGIIRAYIIIKNTTTSLQNVADADILEAQKFGGVASGGVALTLANIVTALGYTPENVANKVTTLTASSVLYPNNNAVIAGLATKVSTTGTLNKVQKITGTNILGDSSISDDGTSVGINGNTQNDNIGDPVHVFNVHSDVGSGAFKYLAQFTGYSNTSGLSNFHIRKARGTFAAPLAVQNQDIIASFGFRGYATTKFASSSVAIQAIAEQNFTDTANGTSLLFQTTPIGNFDSRITALKLQADGRADFATKDGEGARFRASTASGSTFIRFYDSANNGRGYIGNFGSANDFLIDNSSGIINFTGTPIIFNSSSSGRILMGTATDNGVDRVQVSGTINATGNVTTIAGTTANHAVIKSQLDLKANLASPALTGTPTAPTATAGTNTTQIATTAFVQANSRPYKVYTALISQSGTSAPVATVLENTLGGTVVWTRTNVGIYVGTLSGVFTANKTYTSNTFGSFSGFAQFSSSSVNTVNINSTNSSGSLTDGLINGNSIEIRVYN